MAIALIAWDASALAKRYLPEAGSEAVDAIFAQIDPFRMVVTVIGCAETFACLVRRRNAGAIGEKAFLAAKATLRTEILGEIDFGVLGADSDAFFEGIRLVEQYNLNSTDAAILALYLEFQRALPAGRAICVLVSSDRRLLVAAEAEGLKTLNPETVTAADVPALIASV